MLDENQIQLFMSFLHNLFQINIARIKSLEDVAAFEEKFCIIPSLQPMFQAKNLNYLLTAVSPNTYYEISDYMDTSVLIFRFDGEIYLLGPFAKKSCSDAFIQDILLKRRLPYSYMIPLKLYYNGLPLVSSYHLQHACSACMLTFIPDEEEYSYRPLQGLPEDVDFSSVYKDELIDYSKIFIRYDLENNFLNMISTGNTRDLLHAYEELTRYTNQHALPGNTYQNPASGHATIRALARKAAERGGLSVVKIDEITQRSAQKVAAAQNFEEKERFSWEMLYELTDAVRIQNQKAETFSSSIARVLEYLALNYSQEVPLSALTELTHFSEPHLKRKFKDETGFTISQYIMKMRCDKAADLLLSSEFPVQEISFYVGYPDNNYFVKIFKRQFGLTPTDYRKNNKADT